MTEQIQTPITDRLEAQIEAEGKRDVPVRVYQLLRQMESDRARLASALEPFARLKSWQAPKGFSSTVFLDTLRRAQEALRDVQQ